MEKKTTRTLYIALLRLHPGSFRHSFADEMLQVFDEAGECYGHAWLLADLGVSLLRQRLLRWPEESQFAAVEERICLLGGTYPVLRSPHLTARKLSVAFLLSLLSLTLIGPK